MILFACFLFLCCQIKGRPLTFGSNVFGVPYLFNYTQGEGWCNPSFECDIISELCWRLGNDEPCKLTILENLESRITALENDEVDIVVSTFSTSPDRSQRVDFVRPYYYSSGAKIFSFPGDEDFFSSFEDVVSQTICMDLDYYVAQILADEYGLFVFPSTNDVFLEFIQKGYCIAAITDSIFILEGLQQTNLPPIYEQPYTIIISKNPRIQNLKNKLQAAILEMMVKNNGQLSVLERLEKKYIIPQGLQKNQKLKKLSDLITLNGGEYIGVEKEDDIWDAANITSVERLIDELVSIEPSRDKICRDALNSIFESFYNGTKIGNLPSLFFDAFTYTFIYVMDDPNDWINSQKFYQHPYVESGTTAKQIAQMNPQYFSVIKVAQDTFFSDQNNLIQGAQYYSVAPGDNSQLIEDDGEIVLSNGRPTRVLTTYLVQNLQAPTEDNGGQLILSGCGVGELRDW